MRVGVDIVSVERVQKILDRHERRFLERVLTERERSICHDDVRRFAGRFAAKEAVSKALGTGIGRDGITFQDIEIISDDVGAPVVILKDAAMVRFTDLGGLSIALSISHENDFAIAFCVMESSLSETSRSSLNGVGCADE